MEHGTEGGAPAAGAAPKSPAGRAGAAGAATPPEDVLAFHRECLVFDLHIDTLLWTRLFGYDIARRHRNRVPGSPALAHLDLPRAREGGLDAAVMGLVINPERTRSELMLPLRLLSWLESGRGIEQTLATIDLLAEAQRRLPDRLAFVRTGSDLRRAVSEGRFAAMVGLEGSHGIGADLSALGRAYERGLRLIGLVHFQATEAAYPMTVSKFDGLGLTGFGRDLVAEAQRLGVVVDLAHVNAAGVDDALERLRSPFVVSHTACASLHATHRNLTDDQIRRIADRGGVVGIAFARSFLGRPGVDGFLDHVEHALRAGGADAVALGSDFDGAIVPAEGMGDVTCYGRITEGLLARGHGEETVRKVLGGNALRVFTDVCG